MELPKLEKEYQVHVYETGPDGRLSLNALFNYFQDIAANHAVKLGYGREDLLKHNNLWVLSRIYAEVSVWPALGEKILIKTWPRGTDRLFAIRDFVVSSFDGRSVVRATSSWLIIDRDTKRIRRPDINLTRINTAAENHKALDRNAEKIDTTDKEYIKTHDLKVKISDLDVNLHSNNTRYLKWATDSYDLDFVLNNTPLSAEINYLAESRFNESIEIMTRQGPGPGSVFYHSIVRINDNTELCRIRICWKNNRE